MKKLKILISLILLISSASACVLENLDGDLEGNMSNNPITPSRLDMETADNNERANARMESMTEAINNKDTETIISLFSINALNETDDIYGSIDDLYGFIDGEIISWERMSGQSSLGSRLNGKEKEEVSTPYIVRTDTQEYYFLYRDIPTDDFEPGNVGLYLLVVVKLSDRRRIFDPSEGILFDGNEKITRAGVYLPIK